MFQFGHVIVIGKDGVMKVMKIAEKMFVGKALSGGGFSQRRPKGIQYGLSRWQKWASLCQKVQGWRRDPRQRIPFVQDPFQIEGFLFAVHDSEKKNSRVLVHLDPDLKRVKEKVIEFDFSWLELQGRAVKGSTLTAHKVDRVVNAPKSEESESEGKSSFQSCWEKAPPSRSRSPRRIKRV